MSGLLPLHGAILASAMLPWWAVVPPCVLAMLAIAGHLLAMRAAQDRLAPSRLRIRMSNGVVMLLICPLIAFGTAYIDWKAERQAFMLVWLAVMGLLFIVVMLTAIDMLNTARLHREARRALRREAAEMTAILAKLRARGSNQSQGRAGNATGGEDSG